MQPFEFRQTVQNLIKRQPFEFIAVII